MVKNRVNRILCFLICLSMAFTFLNIGNSRGIYGYADTEDIYLKSIVFTYCEKVEIGDKIEELYELKCTDGTLPRIYEGNLILNVTEPMLLTVSSGSELDKIDNVVYENAKIYGKNYGEIRLNIPGYNYNNMKPGTSFYVRVDIAPESAEEAGKMDDDRKQSYLFKIIKAVPLDRAGVKLASEDWPNGKTITPPINPALPFKKDLGAANDFFAKEKVDITVNINRSYQKSVSVTAGAKALTLTSNKFTGSIDLSEIPVENHFRNVDIRITYTPSGTVTEYSIKIPDIDMRPSISSIKNLSDAKIESGEIICEKGTKIEFEVDAESQYGEISYLWTGDYFKKGRYDSRVSIGTEAAGTAYFQCLVDATNEYGRYRSSTETIKVTVLPTYSSGINLQAEPKNVKAKQYEAKPTIDVLARAVDNGGSLSYQWYENDVPENSGGKIIEGATQNRITPSTSEIGKKYYYCEITNNLKLSDGSIAVDKVISKVAEAEIYETEPEGEEKDLEGFAGKGTESNPYIIETGADFTKIRELVNGGNHLVKSYFKMNKDITLPDDWVPIGNPKEGYVWGDLESVQTEAGTKINTFMGTIDGGNYKLTIPKGREGLFYFCREARIKNIKIFGEDIRGSAILNKKIIDYGDIGSYESGVPWTIEVDNVTLVKGSKTSGAGFVSGTGSGANRVWIRNSSVESGVTIGEIGEDYIGSFVGQLNGYIINCTSQATVLGGDMVGGLAGYKPNSMGACTIMNSSFKGSISATGTGVGGLMGSGYIAVSAPNTPLVTIENSYVNADITGKNYVGGIFGGELGSIQPWNYTHIRNNVFYGSVKAMDGVAGGLIGYMGALNRNNNIANNYYCTLGGKINAIGKVREVDTSFAAHETASGANYINTSVEIPGTLSPGTSYRLYSNKDIYNRTDDPLGNDSDKLGKYMTSKEMSDDDILSLLNNGEGSLKNWIANKGLGHPVLDSSPVVYSLSIAGEYKTDYYIGDDIDLKGMVFKGVLTNGQTIIISPEDISVEGFDTKERGKKTVTFSYGSASTQLNISVLKAIDPNISNELKVYFTLMGDDEHDATDENYHTLKKGGLKTWIARTPVTIKDNDTVKDVFIKILGANNLSHKGSSANIYNSYYISAVEMPEKKGSYLSEFSNGPYSGWMYTVNGKHPMVGVDGYFLEDKDEIIFHYTDDYRREEGSEMWYPELNGLAEVVTAKDGNNEVTTVKTEVKKGTETGAGGATISTATVTVKDVSAAEMVKQAKEMKSSEIVLNADKAEANADKVKVELPKKVAENILADTKADLTVKLPEAEVKLSQSALKEIASQAKGDKLVIEVVKVKNPTEEQKKSAGDSAEVFTLTVKSGDIVIHSFGAGKVTVRKLIPERLKDKRVAAIYIPEKGDIEVLDGKKVTIDSKSYYELTTSHFSDFALVDAEEVGIEVAEETMTADEVKSIVKDLKLKATTKALKKSIRITVKADKETLMNLKDNGYMVKYKYYRAVKKNGKYKLISTKKSSKYTDTKAAKGKTYYYKARLAVYDSEGKLIATTSLKNCKASKRQIKKAA